MKSMITLPFRILMMALYYILLMILGFIITVLTCGTTSKPVWQSTGRMFKKKGNGDITRTMGTKGPAINAPGIQEANKQHEPGPAKTVSSEKDWKGAKGGHAETVELEDMAIYYPYKGGMC